MSDDFYHTVMVLSFDVGQDDEEISATLNEKIELKEKGEENLRLDKISTKLYDDILVFTIVSKVPIRGS